MKKQDKEIEQILLNDENYEKFIHQKAEQEFTKILEENKEQGQEFTEISQVPKKMLFSKNATFVVINKSSKTKSFVNGMQAEGFLNGDNFAREKLLSGKTDSFVSGDNFVKFYKLKS